MMTILSTESANLLKELLNHEENPMVVLKKYQDVPKREKVIFTGCLKELQDKKMIFVDYADNGPIFIEILKDGYLYEEHLNEEKSNNLTQFERELDELIDRSNGIKAPINASTGGISIDDYNAPAEEWMNDVKIFHDRYLKEHPLSNQMESLLFSRRLGAFKELISCLKSIRKDTDFINKINGIETIKVPAYKARSLPEYDVFISHANTDKPEIIDNLYNALNLLGVNIFYDKEEIEWGDKWKDRILQGVEKSEFAIIVISENFFGREWTEKELSNFLNRQNRSGQKIILPVLHNITNQQLGEKYPEVADIQTISSSNYNCEEIALLFAKQYIKRLKQI